MSQKSYPRVDLDAWKASHVALVLAGICLERVLSRPELDQVFADVLSDNREIAELTETQRLLTLRLCHTLFDRMYKEWG